MAWKRLRKLAGVILCGGIVLQFTGCQAELASIASSLLSSYLTEAIMSGFLS